MSTTIQSGSSIILYGATQGPPGPAGSMPTTVYTTTSSYTCDSRAGISDWTILCQLDVRGPGTIVLPAATTGRAINVRDIAGNASQCPIVVVAPGGASTVDNDVDGIEINTNGGGIMLVCDGTNWWSLAIR